MHARTSVWPISELDRSAAFMPTIRKSEQARN
jgi:hypothetical protein